MFLLPTKGRLENLKRFLNAAREMGSSLPGLILVNQDDWDANRAGYEALLSLAPPGWTYHQVAADCYGEALRQAEPLYMHLPWVGLVSDDLVPSTSNWDTQLVGALQGWNFVSANDGVQAPARMHGATVWAGELLRAVGWLFPPGLRHIFHDDVWEGLGRETSSWLTRMDVVTRHLHEAYVTGVRGPTMDPESDLWKHDQAVFEAWVRGPEKPAAMARIRAVLERYGVRAMTPDLTGVKLMIATPCMSGDYESSYLLSLYQTFQFAKANNIGVEFAEEKYTADITLARSKLFSAFVHGDATHLLMIDADMGWSVDAVIRLFGAKKDFVAIAGPKKRYPIQFAASYTTPDGTPLNLVYDRECGTMEVSEVGSAFALITRACALQLVKAYPELEVDGIAGRPDYMLFMPTIQKRRYASEDFAFCKRWRAIGGSVHIVPDMKLKHSGKHTFEGAFTDTFAKLQAVPAPMLEAAE